MKHAAPLPAFRYFLLDFDGVVADTESIFAAFDCELLNTALTKAGESPDLTADYVRTLAGMPAAEKLEQIAADRGFDAAPLRGPFMQEREAVRPGLFRRHPPPLARGLAAFLDQNRKYTALVSNKRAYKLEQELLDLGLGTSFAAIISCEPPLRRKPAPDMIFRAMGILGARAEETCNIGDTAFDMQAAIAAGITPAGFVIEGLENAPERASALDDAGAAFVFDDFQHIKHRR
jgi:phosphoglycolate phosphatase